MKSGLMCLIVTRMKQNSQNVPSLHGVELNVLIEEMLESSVLVSRYSVGLTDIMLLKDSVVEIQHFVSCILLDYFSLKD